MTEEFPKRSKKLPVALIIRKNVASSGKRKGPLQRNYPCYHRKYPVLSTDPGEIRPDRFRVRTGSLSGIVRLEIISRYLSNFEPFISSLIQVVVRPGNTRAGTRIRIIPALFRTADGFLVDQE